MGFTLDEDFEKTRNETLPPTRPDLSRTRDEQIQEIYDDLPDLVDNDFLYAVVNTTKETLKPVDIYLTYQATTRELGALEVTPRLPIAVAIVRRPIAVFRDYMERPDTREATVVRYYFGMFKKNGERIFGLVQSHRNIIVKIWTDADELNLLKMINGLRIYKSY